MPKYVMVGTNIYVYLTSDCHLVGWMADPWTPELPECRASGHSLCQPAGEQEFTALVKFRQELPDMPMSSESSLHMHHTVNRGWGCADVPTLYHSSSRCPYPTEVLYGYILNSLMCPDSATVAKDTLFYLAQMTDKLSHLTLSLIIVIFIYTE